MFYDKNHNIDNYESSVGKESDDYQHSHISTNYFMLNNKNTNSSNAITGFNRISCTSTSVYETIKSQTIQQDSNTKYYADSLIVLPNECIQYGTSELLKSPYKDNDNSSPKTNRKKSDSKSLVHSETFTMINPYQTKYMSTDLGSREMIEYESNTNYCAYSDKPNLSSEDQDRLSASQKYNEDKEVDTRDLNDFLIQSTTQSRIPIKNNKTTLSNYRTNLKTQSHCNLTDESHEKNRFKEAKHIKNMLNALLNDIENSSNMTLNDPKGINALKDKISSFSRVNQAKSCDKLVETKSSSYNLEKQIKKPNVKPIKPKKNCPPIKTEKVKTSNNDRNQNHTSTKPLSIQQSQPQSRPAFVNGHGEKLYVRAFCVDPFDELIKSHLSSSDRRLKAISKKADCTIKITGPITNYNSSAGNHANNHKVTYHIYLVADSKDVVDKCLKCLHDSFPLMRLNEISIPSHSNF